MYKPSDINNKTIKTIIATQPTRVPTRVEGTPSILLLYCIIPEVHIPQRIQRSKLGWWIPHLKELKQHY